MKSTRVALAGLLLLSCGLHAAPVPKGDAKDDGEKILGVWTIDKFEGADLPDEEIKKIRFEFKKEGKLAVHRGEDKSKEGSFKLDPKANPKSIDLIPSEGMGERVMPGIYELDGDTLKICMSEGSMAVRPTEFKVVNKRDVIVTFKRVVEEKK